MALYVTNLPDKRDKINERVVERVLMAIIG